MAAHHLQGNTTPGAPDAIIDWFATLVAWLTGTVGWTVAATASNVDYTFRSIGEAGLYTMLHVHIWRVGVGNTIRMEVCDDIIPTHQTNEGGIMDTLGANPFQFWMSANLEMIVTAIAEGAGCRYLSGGCVMQFALNVPDETYTMVASNGQNEGSVLRYHTGVWDRDIWNFGNLLAWRFAVDNLTGAFPLFGMMADQQNNACGQYHLQSFTCDSLVHGDTVETQDPAGSSTWIALHDNQDGHRFALWTGGVIPTGSPDGTWFGSAAGNALTAQILIDAFAAFAVARGWTDHGDPGFPLVAPRINRQFHSVGEDGTRDIWVYLCYDTVTNIFYNCFSTDAIGTHLANIQTSWAGAGWGANYMFAGDRDCLICALQHNVNLAYYAMYHGLPVEAAPWINAYSNVLVARFSALIGGEGAILESHNIPGNWGTQCMVTENQTWLLNSNANAYDGLTYFVNPVEVYEGGWQYLGTLKYINYTSGGGIAQGDTIQIGAKVYTCMLGNAGFNYWYALRTT